jgi:signal transduction histidine kinase
MSVKRFKFFSKRIANFREIHIERHKMEAELRKKIFEKHKSYQEDVDRIKKEFRLNIKDRHKRHDELQWYHRNNKLSRILIVLFNIFIWFIIFRFFGARTIAVIIASIMTIGGVIQFWFNTRLEKMLFKPIGNLKKGVDEISKGNYDIEIESNIYNEIGILIDSFNDMAKKLNESEKLKQVYEENRKNLIANISHDLKTPITSIQGYIETMLERPDIKPDTLNKYHQIIYKNAAYMNKLIDDLFLFSKLDLQKLELELESIPVKAFMADLMEEFLFELQERDIKFTYNDALEQDFQIRIDRKRINQVLRNIIGNAIKYGTDTGIEIAVRLYIEESHACIDVSDNGPGIPEDKLSHIFDRFYRIDVARTKDLMSTGLGLAIAKELVEAHNGSISVVSKENTGSTFTIKIPIEEPV